MNNSHLSLRYSHSVCFSKNIYSHSLFLKARLGALKVQNSKPKSPSTLLGWSEAHLMKSASGVLLWNFLKNHKACF